MKCLLGVCLALLCAVYGTGATAQSVPTHTIYAGREQRSFDAMISELAKADVICLGEEHEHADGHALELSILKGVHAAAPKTALSLEMFERDVQVVLDEYLGGSITETHFLQSSRPWPNYKTDYRPLIEYCKENKLPVVAANAPRRYVNMVSRSGQQSLASLPKASRAFLPRLPYAMDLPPGYDKMLTDLFSGSHAQGQAMPAGMPTPEHMKEAQGLWDATMADSILGFRKSHKGLKVVQVNGAGHSDSGWGLVDRLRKADGRLKVMVVTIQPEASYPSLPAGKYDGVADFVILTPPAKR